MTAEKLPPWQASRLATLLDALSGTPISDAERASLSWLCGFEAHTVNHLAAVIRRAQAVILAKRVAREADRYRRQLVELCGWAGIDPGDDPHAALLAHLRGRPEGPRHGGAR